MLTFYLITRLPTIVRADSVRKDNLHFPEGALVTDRWNSYTGNRSMSYPPGQVNPEPRIEACLARKFYTGQQRRAPCSKTCFKPSSTALPWQWELLWWC